MEFDVKHYLGKSCDRGCSYYDTAGVIIDGAVRYRTTRSCIKCSAEDVRAKKLERLADKDTPATSTKSRRKLEDIALAKELGISVDDL